MIEDRVRGFIGDKSAKVVLLNGDASTRSYYRVLSESGSEIVCFDDPSSSTNSLTRTAQVNQLFHERGIPVPLFKKVDLSMGLALIEDAGDVTLLKELASGDELSLYKKSIDIMLAIHNIKANKEMECFTQAFDRDKLMFEIGHTTKYFLKGFLKIDDLSVEKVEQEFETICKQIESYDRVLVHRDYHSRNIMVSNNSLMVIDYQDARMGMPEYDLVSLLDDCYFGISPANYSQLIQYYMEKSGRKDIDEFQYRYDLMAIQRLFKAIGSFSYMKLVKNDDRYLINIGYAFEKLKVFLQRRNSSLHKLLSTAYYENQ